MHRDENIGGGSDNSIDISKDNKKQLLPHFLDSYLEVISEQKVETSFVLKSVNYQKAIYIFKEVSYLNFLNIYIYI